MEIFSAFSGLNRLLKQAGGWHPIYFGGILLSYLCRLRVITGGIVGQTLQSLDNSYLGWTPIQVMDKEEIFYFVL